MREVPKFTEHSSPSLLLYVPQDVSSARENVVHLLNGEPGMVSSLGSCVRVLLGSAVFVCHLVLCACATCFCSCPVSCARPLRVCLTYFASVCVLLSLHATCLLRVCNIWCARATGSPGAVCVCYLVLVCVCAPVMMIPGLCICATSCHLVLFGGT